MPLPLFSRLCTADSDCPCCPCPMPTQMINRLGRLVDCVATIRWHFGPVHAIITVRFSPMETYTPPSMGLSAPLNPPIASIISSMARDAAHRCAVSSVAATDQPLPVRAAPRPPLTAPLLAAPLTAQAGPRSSVVAQAAAPMVAGSARPGWAAGAGKDAECSLPLIPMALLKSPTADVSGPPSLDDEEIHLLWDVIA
jgi:hypothetical protein